MTVLKRQTERSAFSRKATNLFLSAALFVSCAGAIDRTKITSIAKPSAQTEINEEEKVQRAELLLKELRLDAAQRVIEKYDLNKTGKLEAHEFCDWLLTTKGYKPPVEKQDPNAPKFDVKVALYGIIFKECSREDGMKKQFGKTEFGVDDMKDLVDPFHD